MLMVLKIQFHSVSVLLESDSEGRQQMRRSVKSWLYYDLSQQRKVFCSHPHVLASASVELMYSLVTAWFHDSLSKGNSVKNGYKKCLRKLFY